MDDLRQQLTDNPQALVTFVTTEHFNLRTARAITTSKSNGRAGIFLSTVSGALVALAFIAQLSKGGAAFLAFGLVLFPALLVVGLATYDRCCSPPWRTSRWRSASTGSGASTWRSRPTCGGTWPRRPHPSGSRT